LEIFSFYINIKDSLHPFIIKLTGITDFDVKNGIDLASAHRLFIEFKERNSCDCSVYTWGGDDTNKLYEDLIKN
jgi:DNA polymerase III epsilon subunit-like protein